MMVLWIAMMIVGLVGMIVCSKKQKTNPAMQPVAIVLFIVVVVGAFMLLSEMGIFGNSNASLLNNEISFAASRGYKAGKHLNSVAPGKKVLVITESNYNDENNIMGNKLLAAIKEGYGSENVVAVCVAPANSSDGMPIEEILTAKMMDEVMNQHTDAGAIISTVGLPRDLGKMKYFKDKKAKKEVPPFFLLSFGMGGQQMAKMIESGYISGVITSNPKAQYDVKAPRNPEKAFDIRYILVTKDNVEQHKNQLP